MDRRRSLLGATSIGLALGPLRAVAQSAPYPGRPVRIVVAAGTGGGDDFVARLVAQKLAEVLGQPFIVENRPGAGGSIGQTAVARAAPDGHTLLLAGISMAGAHLVNANIGYDLFRDFTPVSTIEASPFVLVAGPHLQIAGVKDLIGLARSRPGKMSFATIGAGQIPYWGVMLFNSMAGIEAVEVPFKGPPEAIVDVAAGRVDYTVAPMPTVLASRDKVRVLAVTGTARSPVLPDTPTLAEAALPGYDMAAVRGIMGPARMPREVVATLNRAIAQILATPDVRERLAGAGSAVLSGTPEEMATLFEARAAVFEKVARDAGLKPQ